MAKIKTISNAIIDGNTYYYIVSTDNKKYKASIKVDENLMPFLKVGDEIIVYHDNNEIVMEILGLK